MKILFVGDVVGRSGRDCLRDMLEKIKNNYSIDFVIVNGENAAGGKGLTKKVLAELFLYGVDVVTSGNHIWDKKEIFSFIEKERNLLRPLNYPEKITPGKGTGLFKTSVGVIGVLNLSGTALMPGLFCPFYTVEEPLKKLRQETNVVVVDFHAEATSEKMAMGWFLDGRVSAVLGTHTHVQTADERILPQGTAYISDVGMTGALNSILGAKKEIVLKKFVSKLPVRFEVENKPPYQFNAVIVDIDTVTGKAASIERLFDLHPQKS